MATTKAYFKMIERVTSSPEQTLVLVGTALDGPSNKPFSVSTLKSVEDIIGNSPLAQAYVSAAKTGVQNIILYRLNGTHATGLLQYSGINVIRFQSIGAGADYNNIMIDVGPDKVVVTNVNGTERIYFFETYPSARRIVDAINLDASYGLLEFTAVALDPTFSMYSFNEDHLYTVLFSGGSSEDDLILDRTNKVVTLEARLKEALFGGDPDDQATGEPNSLLGLMDYGIVCLVDMFHDDQPAKFSELLATFCQNKSKQGGSGCIGVIGTTPLMGNITTQSITDRVIALKTKAPNRGALANIETVSTYEAKPISYVQIVTGDTSMSSILGETVRPTSLAYAYAATQAFLPYDVSMTNKTLGGISNLNYEFEKKDLEDLCSNGYISIVSSIRKGFVPYSAVTGMGKSSSMMKSPHVVRITQAVTKRVEDYLDDYVGSTSSAISRTALARGIEQVIKEFVDAGVVKDFTVALDFIVPTSEARVHISITPFSSIGTVSSTINMPFNRGVIR